MKKHYRQLLAYARASLKKGLSPRQQIKQVREVLKAFNLKTYCRDMISFRDFSEDKCTNCQGQTMLFVALLLDLQIIADAPWRLGIQIMSNHVRPVLYNGKDLIDLVYATIEKDSGDPIFNAEYLLYLALKNHNTELPPGFLDNVVSSEFLKPLNVSSLRWFIEETLSFSNHSPKIEGSDNHLQLYDFSGIRTKTFFNEGEVPEKAILNLDGDLERPRLRFSQPPPRLAVTNAVRCEDDQLLIEMLNSQELADLRRIQATGTMTSEDISKYKFVSGERIHCPGAFFTKEGSTDTRFFAPFERPRVIPKVC